MSTGDKVIGGVIGCCLCGGVILVVVLTGTWTSVLPLAAKRSTSGADPVQIIISAENSTEPSVIWCRSFWEHVYLDSEMTKTIIGSEYSCEVNTRYGPCNQPPTMVFSFFNQKPAPQSVTLYGDPDHLAIYGTSCWYQSMSAALKPGNRQGQGPIKQTQLELYVKDTVSGDQSYVEGLSNGARLAYIPKEGEGFDAFCEPLEPPSGLSIVDNGQGVPTVLSDKHSVGGGAAGCDCKNWTTAPECNTDACLASCPGNTRGGRRNGEVPHVSHPARGPAGAGAIDGWACGLRECFIWYYKRGQNSSSYTHWLTQSGCQG